MPPLKGDARDTAVETMKERQKSTLAAALHYDNTKGGAPRVTAKGRGAVAERIMELARQKGIPLRSDPALVEALCKLDVEMEIPEQLYRIVAEVLAFVYTMNEKRKELQGPEG
jgi:flagellar biosynthesis protein